VPRGKQTEESLVRRIEALDAKRKALKKKLQVLRIRAAAKRRKAMMSTLRRNEKEVLEVIRSKAPDFFKKLVGDEAEGTRRRGRRAKAVAK
jgi:hypothetical protein